MDSDPGILCFKHCNVRVFCFQLPEYCPACRVPLEESNAILPFRVPYPFVRGSQYPCSVIIKPTSGDFLNDYKVSMDLHIGVTSSRGKVFEFDRGGLHRDREKRWEQCLVIHQAREEQSLHDWDFTLNAIADQDCWTTARYNEETFNCYTFVLSFIKCLRYGVISETASSKTKFCELFVSPKVMLACKYVGLYRRLKDSGYFVSRNPLNENNPVFRKY